MSTQKDLDIDKMLREVYNARDKGGCGYGYMYDYSGSQYNQNNGAKVAKVLHENGLVDWKGYPDGADEKDMMYIEDKGENMQKNGGWLVHLSRQVKQAERPNISRKRIPKYTFSKIQEKKTHPAMTAFVKFLIALAVTVLGGIIILAIQYKWFEK